MGKSISDTSKKAGSKISESFREIKSSEKTEKVKIGFLRFATKVKGFFSGEQTPQEEEKVTPDQTRNQHDAAKNDIGLSDDDEEVPEMLKLDDHRERSRTPSDHSDEEEETKEAAGFRGQSNEVFSRRP